MADKNKLRMPPDVAHSEAKARAQAPAGEYEMDEMDLLEKDIADKCIKHLERYKEDRKVKEREWSESYAMYMSFIDENRNPFMANLFIPKTHEAVELISAFLIGPTQAVTVRPERDHNNYQKAVVAEKYLDVLWRKKVKARQKLLVGVKQATVFGNSVLKVGYDGAEGAPYLANTSIEDVYFDFFEPNIQDSLYIFHEIRRSKQDVMDDPKYDQIDKDGNLIREQVIEKSEWEDKTVSFSRYDAALNAPQCDGKTPLIEVWSHKSIGNEILTLAPTKLGWRVLRKKTNKLAWNDGTVYRPFSKIRFKISPLSNRAYDTGAIFPTIRIQQAFNDLINQYFDGVVMVNNPMWIRRRGAGVNPRDLVRRPGGIITVGNINQDLKPDQTPDIKPSIVEMIERLDKEFQQSSMVVNLLKSMPGSDFATEAVLAQDNFNVLMKPLMDNISEAFSEIGAMLLNIAVANSSGKETLKLFENDAEIGVLEFDPKDLDALMDVEIVPDTNANLSKVVRQKQLVDFLKIVASDQPVMARFPKLTEKIYRKWLDEAGFKDVDDFFEELGAVGGMMGMNGEGAVPGMPGVGGLPTPEQGLSPQGIIQSAAPAGASAGF